MSQSRRQKKIRAQASTIARLIVAQMARGTSCVYCGARLSWEERTGDHFVAKSRGGQVIVDCCLSCNRDKGHLSLNEWRAVLSLRNRRIHIFSFERWVLRGLVWAFAPIVMRLI